MNSTILTGRLTRDPELKYIESGTAICELGLAVNDPYKKDHTSFFDIKIWGKSGEVAGNHLKKGSHIAVEGKLVQERWEKDGQNRSKVVIECQRFEFLDPKPEGGEPYKKTEGKTFEDGFSDGDDGDSVPF